MDTTQLLKRVTMVDQVGAPVVLSVKGKNSHRTLLGGLCTISLFSFISAYFVWRVYLY